MAADAHGASGAAAPELTAVAIEAQDRSASLLRLDQLPGKAGAVVRRVESVGDDDPIAERLRELGFVDGEPVRVVAAGPIKADPLLVQIGFTRFALRRVEAARVLVSLEARPGST